MSSPVGPGHPWRAQNELTFDRRFNGGRTAGTEWRCWGEADEQAVTCRADYPKAAAEDAASLLGLEEGFVHMAGSTRSGYYTYRYLVAGGKVLGRG